MSKITSKDFHSDDHVTLEDGIRVSIFDVRFVRNSLDQLCMEIPTLGRRYNNIVESGIVGGMAVGAAASLPFTAKFVYDNVPIGG